MQPHPLALEDYPGQNYFHAHNPNIRRAETTFKKKSKCWEWSATKSHNGYGQTSVASVPIRASRLMAIIWLGIEPDDPRQVCHKCDNPSCVNPHHLFMATASENQLDSVAKGRQRNTRKKECIHGHPFDLQNTLFHTRKNGKKERICRMCHNMRKRKLYRKGKGELPSLAATNPA